ncbi:MAG: hypothetical protein H0X17_03080 [Deltaproteobacteria bacterium]|nr:hypothetical protein [Deltaproteobacteria bacterium]
MPRLAVVLLALPLAVLGCSKSAGKQDKVDEPMQDRAQGEGDRVAVPGARGAPAVGGAPTADSTAGEGTGGGAAKVDDSRFRLSAEEGQLAVEMPAGAKAGTETIAKIVVTPGSAYKVNTEFPTKLTLVGADGVTLAKTELKAGGHDKAKGDAEQFDESKLTFVVKLTPTQSGSHTINGTFKFAVCDKAGSTCLAKKEAIAIQVAAQ